MRGGADLEVARRRASVRCARAVCEQQVGRRVECCAVVPAGLQQASIESSGMLTVCSRVRAFSDIFWIGATPTSA